MDENCWTVGVLGDSSLFVSVSFDGVCPPCGLIKWHFLLEMFNYKTVHVKISCPVKSEFWLLVTGACKIPGRFCKFTGYT